MKNSIEGILIEETWIQSLPQLEEGTFELLSFFLERGNQFLFCSEVREWYEKLKDRCTFETDCIIPDETPLPFPDTTLVNNLTSFPFEDDWITLTQSKEESVEVTSLRDTISPSVHPLVNQTSEATPPSNKPSPALGKAFLISGVCLITISGLILLCPFLIKICLSKRKHYRPFYPPMIYMNPSYEGRSAHSQEDIALERI